MKVILFIIVLWGSEVHSVEERIVVPTDDKEEKHNYVVSIQNTLQINDTTRGHHAGGVLVTYSHVLTTATSVYFENSITGAYELIDSTEYRVVAGVKTLSNDTDDNHVRQIQNIIAHDSKILWLKINDIAVIMLTSAFTTDTVSVIALSSAPADFATCTLAGWGSYSASSTTNLNRTYTSKFIYNQELCQLIYSHLGLGLQSTMMCAASIKAVYSGCDTEIGNPLVCGGYLCGILIYSQDCLNITSRRPDVYTRISSYNAWIVKITGASVATASSANKLERIGNKLIILLLIFYCVKLGNGIM